MRRRRWVPRAWTASGSRRWSSAAARPGWPPAPTWPGGAGRLWFLDAPRGEGFEPVVVGGGQAGLATGHHLARRGRPFVILDAGQRVGDPWRGRWDSLRLFTPARYSGLPGIGFPAPARH